MASKNLPDFTEENKYVKGSPQKILKKESFVYMNFPNQGIAYILNESNSDTTKLTANLKSLGFIKREYSNYYPFINKIKTDTGDTMKYNEDFCIAVITILDNTKCEEDDLVEKFHSDNCPALECKPKLFFFLKLSEGRNNYSEEADSAMEYELPVQADILIYKHSSPTAVKDLCQLLQRFLPENSNNYVSDELTSHIRNLTSKPTIHDMLTRRLYLQRRRIHYDMKTLFNKNLNRKILSAMDFMEDCNDAGDDSLSKLLDDLKETLQLAIVKGKIMGDPNCYIEKGTEILQKIESAIFQETNVNNKSD
ncbi:uncharacterized protein LOC143919000 [Arctopsyche grandis]|uniref:uncharacterized protein LOC143919000 n=1 Tax=Arctopsyche grandis TaxID=121162 RepID=UPI00406D8BCC